jgi:hypothetical protein
MGSSRYSDPMQPVSDASASTSSHKVPHRCERRTLLVAKGGPKSLRDADESSRTGPRVKAMRRGFKAEADRRDEIIRRGAG